MRRFLRQRDEIYFLSIAFDLSENKPVVLPPKDLPKEAVYKVSPGDTIEFTLGDGAPVFPPRAIVGGLTMRDVARLKDEAGLTSVNSRRYYRIDETLDELVGMLAATRPGSRRRNGLLEVKSDLDGD